MTAFPTSKATAFSIVAVMTILSCNQHKDPVAVMKGSRQTGIHVTQAESNEYVTEFDRVKAMGVDVIPFTLPWNTLETAHGFDFTNLTTINSFFPSTGTKVSINISPIYTVNRGMPDDLAGKAFNNPEVISRFKVLLDSVHRKLKDTDVNNIIIGLEVDLYLNNHPEEWAAYKELYESAQTHIHALWGTSLPVGVEITWSAATGTSKNDAINLNENSDMMVLSYYPNQADFTVKPPEAVHADIESVLALYPTMPVFIVETGYQTSTSCNSSEEKQKQFIVEMFKLWDNHADRINFIGFLWLTDLSDVLVDQYVADYQAGGLPSLAAFRGYLQTTGLRTYPGMGTDKPGFTQLTTELNARGWK